jgi:hypothetical protein
MNRILRVFVKDSAPLFETTIMQQLENDRKKALLFPGSELQSKQQFLTHIPIIMQKFVIFFETQSKQSFNEKRIYQEYSGRQAHCQESNN